MTSGVRLELLLATYNSEPYLAELLGSLLNQTMDDFVLLVSDDGSTDGTMEILESHAPRFRHAVRYVHPETPTGSASANFGHLLRQSSAPHVMLVDHDDVWYPKKVENGTAAITRLENRIGADRPALVHSDLAVIGANGEALAPSYWAMRQIDPECSRSLRRSLIHASVVGCTTTMNRALIEKALPIPETAVMHDWWLTLIASACGEVDYIAEPQIGYRIHGANVSNPGTTSVGTALARSGYRKIMQQKIAVRADQANALADRLEVDFPAEAALARYFAAIPEQSFIGKRGTVLANRFFFPGLWRNLAMLAAM